MKPVLFSMPGPSWTVILLVLALIAAVDVGWLLWLRRRQRLTRDHVYTGVAVVIMSAVVLFILGRINEVRINSYGAMLMVGFVVGTLSAIRLGRRRGVAAEQVLDLGLLILIGAVVGARVGYVLITKGEPLIDLNRVLYEGMGGLSFHGGLIGGFLTGSAYILFSRLSYWRVVDALAPSVAIGYAITRIGCFLNGCCYGKPTDVPWAVVFPHMPDAAFRTVPVHPTQLYAAAMGVAIFLVLLLLSRGRSLGRAGRLFMLLLMLEGIERFVMEIFRMPDPHYAGSITPAQLVSIGLVILGVAGWFMLPKTPAVVDVPQSDAEKPTAVK